MLIPRRSGDDDQGTCQWPNGSIRGFGFVDGFHGDQQPIVGILDVRLDSVLNITFTRSYGTR